MLRDHKLDFWVEHGLNVLLVGKHGVGKTSLVKAAFERANLNWKYFSASTMDPWVDFVGVPRAVETDFDVEGDDGKIVTKKITHLELVRPKEFATNEIEALFFDEFNRSPKKVRNAVMELMQFKSINGVRFPNLKIVWAAINPDDEEEYDVERIDPAQEDRFHIKINIPYAPDRDWFAKAFGDRTADASIEWWNGLSDEIKNLVSPRRLEYALKVYKLRGDIRDVLPATSNITKLVQSLSTGPITEKLESYMAAKDRTGGRLFLSNENNYTQAMKFIPETVPMMEFYLPLLAKEKLGSLLNANEKCCRFIMNNMGRVTVFRDVCRAIVEAAADQKLVRRIKKALTEDEALNKAFNDDSEIVAADDPHIGQTESTDWANDLNRFNKMPIDTSEQRMQIFRLIEENVPGNMTTDEAVSTLGMLNKIISSFFSSSITIKPLAKLPGIINTCLLQIADKDGNLTYNQIVERYGSKFSDLIKKIEENNIGHKLWKGN